MQHHGATRALLRDEPFEAKEIDDDRFVDALEMRRKDALDAVEHAIVHPHRAAVQNDSVPRAATADVGDAVQRGTNSTPPFARMPRN